MRRRSLLLLLPALAAAALAIGGLRPEAPAKTGGPDRRIDDPGAVRIVDGDTRSVFHLAAIVSGMAESDFDLGLRINVDATRALLEACRLAGRRPRLVFTSSVAV